MNILFCSPYEQRPGIVTGGLNIWGKSIIDYYRESGAEIDLTPVSFDRVYYVTDKSSTLARIWYGVKDYRDSIRKTFQIIKDGRFDVLHLCTSAQLSLYKDYYILRRAHEYGVKTCIHFHFGRIPELLSKNNWEGKLICKVCNVADSIIVMDLKWLEALKLRGYGNVYYLPNPLSMPIIRQINEQHNSVTRRSNKIISVGHVIPTKGVFELVKGCKDVDGIELHLIGPVDDFTRSELESIAKTKNNGAWLKVRGSMSHEEVIKEMLSAEMFVFPSYTEGFPNVILEAMACGCAIAATPVGAIPEMLCFNTKDFCGLELKVKDTDSVARRVAEFKEDKDLVRHCTTFAKRRVYDQYAMPKVWEQIVDIWNNTNRNECNRFN